MAPTAPDRERPPCYRLTHLMLAGDHHQDLDADRRSSERGFAKREKQIEMLLRNSAGLYGELQAIVGGGLRPVEALELPAGDEEGPEPLALAS